MISFPGGGLLALLALPLRLLRGHPWQVLCLALAVLAWRIHAGAQDWRERARSEATSHIRTKTQYRAAQAKAAAQAEAARIATEAHYAHIAKEADDADLEANLWRARALRFADHGGLRSCPPNPAVGTSGVPAAPGEDNPASGHHPTGGPSVTLSRNDFDTLSANTERLLKVHAWGERLIAQGLAITAETGDKVPRSAPPQ